MLIKVSKLKYVVLLKQDFCENSSKFANLTDFVSQKKKDVIFSNISEGENIEKKTSDF